MDTGKYIINENVYLVINDVRVSSTNITEISKDRLIGFSELSFINHTEMTENNKFILDLLNETVNGNKIAHTDESGSMSDTSLNFLEMIWDDETEVDPYYRWGVNSDSYEDARVRTIIADQFEGVRFSRVCGGREIKFFLDIVPSDDLPQRLMTLIEEIYTACDLDDSSYTDIYFYNENTDKRGDRLRVFFGRNQYRSSFREKDGEQPDVGKMNRFAFVSGPTFGRYADEIEVLFDTMDFFISKLRDQFLK